MYSIILNKQINLLINYNLLRFLKKNTVTFKRLCGEKTQNSKKYSILILKNNLLFFYELQITDCLLYFRFLDLKNQKIYQTQWVFVKNFA